MRVPTHRARGDISENMMTSMIDVVFLLLIFFVCAAAGAVHEFLLPTDLAATGEIASVVPPAAKRSAPVDEILLYLATDSNRRLVTRLNGTEYGTLEELRRVLLTLGELAPESPVTLDISPDVEAGDMVAVYDTCRRAKFNTIQFKAHAAPGDK
jgi:biopolymer transport protein ExbD